MFVTKTPSRRIEGPDLALIVLPVDKISLIKEWKRFFDLTKYGDWLKEHPLHMSDGVWAVCGTPEEDIRYEVDRSLLQFKIADFKSLVMLSGPERTHDFGEFDYLDIGVNYLSSCDIPGKFNGVSGGGLWQVIIREDESNALSCDEPILSGVAFYEIETESRERKFIRCHGPRGISFLFARSVWRVN